MQLLTREINPRLLKCAYFNGYEMEKGIRMASRVCYDYEFEYYIKSNGGIKVNEEYIPFAEGEMNIRKPGQMVCGYPQYECYIICFSITGKERADEQYGFGTRKNAQPLYENELISALPNKFIPTNKARITALFRELFQIVQNKGELNSFKESTLLYELLYEVFRQCSLHSPISTTSISVSRDVKKAVDYIKENFCEKISIEALVCKADLSKAYFHRCFKEYTGMTPKKLIAFLRIEKAKNLLCMTNNKISDICEFCGYDDDVYFSHIFKRETGMTPTKFRAHMTI